MDDSDLWGKYGPTARHYMLPIVLGVVGFGMVLYGLIVSVLPKNTADEVIFESASAQEQSEKSEEKQIIVDVAGAVLKPGVYKLPQDARVQDGLIAAGGMSQEADREKVAKGMNLAGKLIDGGKIYIPFVGDATAPQGGGSPLRQGFVGQAGQVAGETVNGLININTATAGELDTLSGVGPATAEKIIANRPYEKIEDLVSKKAVGNSVFEKIKDRISVF